MTIRQSSIIWLFTAVLCFVGPTDVRGADGPAATRPAALNLLHSHHLHAHHGPLPTTRDAGRFITSRPGAAALPLTVPDSAFTFVVLGDRTGGPPAGVNVLADAVCDVNLLDPDLVMTVGDLVQGYNGTPQWLEQMREFKSIMERLNCPWFPVAGNHDIYWRDRSRVGENKPLGEHEQSFEKHFGPLWYAFEHKNAWFITLFSDEGNPDTGEKNFNKAECNGISEEQFQWLRQTLKKARNAGHVFIFLHHPRWLGLTDMPSYGDGWDRVHRELVAAGNVSAVFAGHIHYMRHDPRDGIQYVSLATTGGAQSGTVPRAGFLHQYHVVTVRKDRVSMVAYPVGAALDVREITGGLVNETLALASVQPQFSAPLSLGVDGSAAQTLTIAAANPTTRPVEFRFAPESRDSRWSYEPDHHRILVPPGESAQAVFDVRRIAGPIDGTLRLLELALHAEYLAPGQRYPLPERRFPVPIDLETLPVRPEAGSIALDGRAAVVLPASELKALAGGPFTLETRFRANRFKPRNGLLCKTQNSGYGIFISGGRPSCSIFLGDRYLSVRAPAGMTLESGRWHHIAQVFDGAELRLYVDGELVERGRGAGRFVDNQLPMIIGGDVDGHGSPTDTLDGEIESVRISSVARYAWASFKPAQRLASDQDTVLLLNMDRALGAWLLDESPAKRLIAMPDGVRRLARAHIPLTAE